jgi:hypothetical protein
MAALANTHPTLLDVTRRLDPNGKIDTIGEILTQTNEILEDMVWLEGNLPTGHRTTIRSGLPTPTWRKLYGGVQPTKSTTVQVTDSCGMLEAYAEIDKALADLNGNTAAFRLSEDRAHIEGMNQEFAQTLFYGNEGSEPEAFTGLLPRFNSTSAANGDNVIKGGGAVNQPNCTSVWLICWGPNTVHGIYPKASKAGLQMTDKGQVTIESIDNAGGRMEAYRTHYRWDCGLSVRDWRYVVRASNIDITTTTFAGSGANDTYLPRIMGRMVEALPSTSMGRMCFYVNRTIKSMLRQQIAEAVKGSTLTMEQVGGKSVMMVDGIPVKRCDQITNSETGL